jgi:hypothetical protein
MNFNIYNMTDLDEKFSLFCILPEICVFFLHKRYMSIFCTCFFT